MPGPGTVKSVSALRAASIKKPNTNFMSKSLSLLCSLALVTAVTVSAATPHRQRAKEYPSEPAPLSRVMPGYAVKADNPAVLKNLNAQRFKNFHNPEGLRVQSSRSTKRMSAPARAASTAPLPTLAGNVLTSANWYGADNSVRTTCPHPPEATSP